MLARSLGKKANSVGVMFGANAAASFLSLDRVVMVNISENRFLIIPSFPVHNRHFAFFSQVDYSLIVKDEVKAYR